MFANTSNAACNVEILQGSAYGSLFFLGLLVNAAALWAFIAKRYWTDTYIYMFNLAIADTALVLFLPFRIYDAFFCLPKTTLCTFLINIHFINMYASILTTTAISVQRYLVIRFPLQARTWRKKKKTAFAVCLVIWVLLVTICTVFRKDNYPDKLWTCYERCKNHRLQKEFIVILLLLGFFIPLMIVVFCTSRIICILSKAENKSEEKKNIIGLVTANMIVFIVCYTPIHTGFLVNYFYSPPSNWQSVYIPAHAYLLVSEWIAATNCCFDSISYSFLLKKGFNKTERRQVPSGIEQRTLLTTLPPCRPYSENGGLIT